MDRYLVVANRTLGGEHLLSEVRHRLERGPCRFHVVVPVTPAAEHGSWNEGHSRAEAQKRLDVALTKFGELGAEVTGSWATNRQCWQSATRCASRSSTGSSSRLSDPERRAG